MDSKIKYTIGPDVDLNKTIIRDKNGRRITNKRAEKMAQQAINKMIESEQLASQGNKTPQAKLRLPLKLRKLLKKRG